MKKQTLTGNLDRVDWREQEDTEGADRRGASSSTYKTVRIKALRPDIWADDAFWDARNPKKLRSRLPDQTPNMLFCQ